MVADVLDADAGRGVQEGRLHLAAAQPAPPGLEADQRAGLVVDRVAVDQVEQAGDLLPDGADIRLPGAVEGGSQQHRAVAAGRPAAVGLGLEHGDAHRMDAADALHRVRHHPRQVLLVAEAATLVQRAQQPPHPGRVGDRVERGHEAGPDRRQHGQVGGAAEAGGLGSELAAHAHTPAGAGRCADARRSRRPAHPLG
ncbi:hypothetical protein ABXN37_18690 [Piscinibacter sakaiensis]|uniref:hypothetical protein n=1 Tax=Piscinibacter sakaiensis TaxID=1547922 RepID=UPI00372B6FC8